MIIWGSRMYGRRQRGGGYGSCDHCGVFGPQKDYTARKWGHLYFVPLIPLGGHVRVIGECGKCGHGAHLPVADAEQAHAAAFAAGSEAADKIDAGEAVFQDEAGKQRHAALDVIAAAMAVGSLGDEEGASELLNRARAGDAVGEAFVAAALHTHAGGLPLAIEAYDDLLAVDPDNFYASLLRADALDKAGCRDEATAAFKQLAATNPELPELQGRLIDLYVAAKRWPEAANQMEQAFAAHPELREQPQLQKLYKKACKKAKRTPLPT
jgi:tetratricopeptide (TPR) repeat protein